MCRPGESTTVQDQQAQQQSLLQSPFSIRPLTNSTYLIRENDAFGEHPHIYAKICTTPDDSGVIVLSDTGVGTTKGDINIWTFLSATINKAGLPYIVILSHCHYDHILGLSHAPTNQALAIVASSYQPSFITPYSTLQRHSLCESYNLTTPHYTVSVWAADAEKLVSPAHPNLDLGITTVHTPGHTPDSLSFYDAHNRTLFVGDSFYAQQSPDSRIAPWGSEASAPIIFPAEGDLAAWWKSLRGLIAFVARENERVEGERAERTPVRLAAGHVTAEVEAYEFLLKVREFMATVLRAEVPFEDIPSKRGLERKWWREDGGGDESGHVAEFSLVAPLRLVEDGRQRIPAEEWL